MFHKRTLDFQYISLMGLSDTLWEHGDHIASLPDDVIRFTKEWERAAKSVINKPEYFLEMGSIGKIFTFLPNNFAKTLNNFATKIPHRTFYYAARFAEACLFGLQKLDEAACNSKQMTVFNFGSGLSPLTSYLQYKYPSNTKHWIIDKQPIITDIHFEILKELKLPTNNLEYFYELNAVVDDERWNKEEIMLLSLNTLPYMTKEKQIALLTLIIEKFGHFFIELEHKSNSGARDKKIAKAADNERADGWEKSELNELLKIPTWNMADLKDMVERHNSYLGGDSRLLDSEFVTKYPDLYKSIVKNNTELFVQR